MPKIEIETKGVQGTVMVDGAKVHGVTGYRIEHRVAQWPVVVIDMAVREQQLVLHDGALKIGSIVAPEALERALLAHLFAKHGAPDGSTYEVTALDDGSRKWATVPPLKAANPGETP